jgi:hypothetical protein
VIYSIADQVTQGGNGSCLWEIRTASSDMARLVELGSSNAIDITPSAVSYGLGRPAARGVTPTTPLTMLAEDEAGPAGTVQTAQAWGTAPTAPANFFRRYRNFHFNSYDFLFPQGLVIKVSASFVIWTLTGGTATAQQVYAVVDE